MNVDNDVKSNYESDKYTVTAALVKLIIGNCTGDFRRLVVAKQRE